MNGKKIEFGTEIECRGTKYKVLCYKPDFSGHITTNYQSKNGLGNFSTQYKDVERIKGKILVYNPECETTNWYSLDDFPFKTV